MQTWLDVVGGAVAIAVALAEMRGRYRMRDLEKTMFAVRTASMAGIAGGGWGYGQEGRMNERLGVTMLSCLAPLGPPRVSSCPPPLLQLLWERLERVRPSRALSRASIPTQFQPWNSATKTFSARSLP